MWKEAEKTIAESFFKDKINLYEILYEFNSIGESLEKTNFIGEFDCNIQYNPAQVTREMVGKNIIQSVRISSLKSLPLDYEKTYKVKIKSAKLDFDNKFWNLDSWEETQISKVLTVVRQAIV